MIMRETNRDLTLEKKGKINMAKKEERLILHRLILHSRFFD